MIPTTFEYHAPASRLKDPAGLDVGSARHRSETPQGITYFCCVGCKEAFDREPQRFAASRE
jgi:YHS domain-containing protein